MSSPSPVEVVFLGTGTSSSLPQIDCITAHAMPGSSDRPPCRTCLSTIDGTVFSSAEGKKNIRRNTSVVVRLPGRTGSCSTILIDCGKNFQAAALEWFPPFQLRRIDAVLITHAHADAVNGLDDLRAWTLNGRIQPHIDVYVSFDTYSSIKLMFPYLVSKEFASGGGDVPEFVWHIIEESPFEITDTGITVTPFSVQHGRLFTRGLAATPGGESPPIETRMTQATLGDAFLPLNSYENAALPEVVVPYMCFAFRIQEDIVYLSDVGNIPDSAWSTLFPPSGKQLPVCILDCLNLGTHPSHFGLDQSLVAARKINAKRTYLLGFSHEVAHDEWLRISEMIGGAESPPNPSENELKAMGMIGEGAKIWVRPAHDGLRIQISNEQLVRDETYE
ncbi:beta-lactamase-like protein [Mycena rebaudengoi]|nr:beta-lactamase-like protein [Mycena rebaudengoi]